MINICTYLIFLETTITGLHFAAEIFTLGSGNFVYFCKSDVSAVQGHPRSLMLVPIESTNLTSY